MDSLFNKSFSELESRLPTNLENDPFRFFMLINIEHPLPEHRLKIELVCNVKISGNRFGITIYHNGLIAHLLRRSYGMNAGVIELDTLADTVWTASQDHHFLAIRDFTLVFPLIG